MAVPTKLISTSQGFQSANGTVVALGLLSLTLSQNAEIIATNGQVTTEPLYFPLDANGKITSTAIWFNDELTPSGTTYRAILYASNGMRIIQDFGYWSITGASADLSTMIPTSIGGPSAAGVVLLAPSGNQVVVQPSGTSLSVNRFEQIRFADQFTGADAGAKIQAAHDDLPAGGGVIDATALIGAQAAAATITLSKTCLLKLGTITLTSAGSPVISITASGVRIEGISETASVLITSSGTADLVQINNTFSYVANLGFRSGVARTGGAGINLASNSSNGTGKSLRFDKVWNGIQCSSSTGTGNSYFNDIQMAAGLSATGNWNNGIMLGNVASGTVASFHFEGVRIIGDASFATAMVMLDSGVDTPLFTNCEFVQSGTSNICVLAQGNNTGQNPSWAKFVNCVFEAGTTKQALNIQKATSFKCVNCNIATSLTGISIGPASPADVKDFRFINGEIIVCQQSAVAVTASTGGVEISGNWIADSSQASNGGFNAIQVSGTCTNVMLSRNEFGLTGLGNGNLPFQDISVANAGADKFFILNNLFTQGLGDSSVGATNKQILGNSPASTGNTINGTILTTANATQQTSNAAQWIQGQSSELLTLSTAGTTTDTTGNLLPANSIIESVVARVTTTITTATDWKLGDATTAGRFAAANATMTAGATSIGTVQADQTGAPGPRQAAAAKVRVTTTGTPGAGVIRITVFYRQFVAPTS